MGNSAANKKLNNSHIINVLLTLTSSGPYWENITLGVSNTDRAYQKDLRRYFSQYVPNARLIRSKSAPGNDLHTELNLIGNLVFCLV